MSLLKVETVTSVFKTTVDDRLGPQITMTNHSVITLFTSIDQVPALASVAGRVKSEDIIRHQPQMSVHVFFRHFMASHQEIFEWFSKSVPRNLVMAKWWGFNMSEFIFHLPQCKLYATSGIFLEFCERFLNENSFRNDCIGAYEQLKQQIKKKTPKLSVGYPLVPALASANSPLPNG